MGVEIKNAVQEEGFKGARTGCVKKLVGKGYQPAVRISIYEKEERDYTKQAVRHLAVRVVSETMI